MGRNALVRLVFLLWGFKASIFLLIIASWDSWDSLDQKLASMDEDRKKCDGVIENEGEMNRIAIVDVTLFIPESGINDLSHKSDDSMRSFVLATTGELQLG
ncbi:hypothetical protein Tco_1220935 [Tanacetum coccineum]